MKVFFSFILLFSYWLGANAQWSENFSDGDLTANPIWMGQTNQFKVNASAQLQSALTSAGIAYTSTEVEMSGTISWEFYVKMSFSPSASNATRVYLMSDTSNLLGTLNGYFIQLGEAGSKDAIRLYRQDSYKTVEILAGKPGHVANSSNTLRIKISRNDTGFWQLVADTIGGNNFMPEAEGVDNVYSSASYFGIVCILTASNLTKVIMDDIKITKVEKDTLPPIPIKIKSVSSQILHVTFNEPLDTLLSRLSGVFLLNDKDTPQSVVFLSDSQVSLYFQSGFTPNVKNTVSIDNIYDHSGNKSGLTYLDFEWKVYPSFGVYINELMPDPDPAVQLPAVEYIELYNNNAMPVPLLGWRIADSTSSATFSNDTLMPGQYAIVCSAKDYTVFSAYGKTVTVSKLPVLNNSADIIYLYNKENELVDKVSYNQSWYKNSSKLNGGWSLEKRFPLDSCSQGDNWAASEDESGGTPGQPNSIYSKTSDSTAPILINYTVIDSTHIQLVFSKNMVISNGGWLINGFLIDSIHYVSERRIVNVFYKNKFIPNSPNKFFASEIKDCLGNKSAAVQFDFEYAFFDEPLLYDVIINEIMADPVPSLGSLPEAEYIELFNRSKKVLNTGNWKILTGNRSYALPSGVLKPGELVILCANNYLPQFSALGETIGLNSFPALNNTGAELSLLSDKNKLLDYIEYSTLTYADSFKKMGGWSLERIDSNATCTIDGNWIASKDSRGGTPGSKNSVITSIKDKTPPQPFHLSVEDSVTLLLYLREPADSSSILNIKNYTLNQGMTVQQINPLFPSYKAVIIKLASPIISNTNYILRVQNLEDCNGNKSKSKDFRFTLPQKPDSGNIIINEFLFNPAPGNVDFVEVYNPTDKTFDLRQLYIANADEKGNVKDFFPVTDKGYLFFPGDYVVFTSNPVLTFTYYYIPAPEKLLKCNMPSYNDDGGTIMLLRKDGKILDKVTYSEKWHFSLLYNKEGVSLERINSGLPSNYSSTWHSAASTVGYATPTYINSQNSPLSNNKKSDRIIVLDTAVFSPDNDGYQDVLNIRYQFSNTGNAASLNIYNANGYLIRHLANNQLLGTSGYLHWDGLEDNSRKAPIGIYILIFEFVNPDGTSEAVKLSCTLTTRL